MTRGPLALLFALLVVSLTVAQGVQPPEAARTTVDVSALGPQIGDRVPDFSLQDQSGTTRTLQSIMGPRGAMLVFVRSAEW